MDAQTGLCVRDAMIFRHLKSKLLEWLTLVESQPSALLMLASHCARLLATFAPTLWKFCSCTKKNFLHSFATIFRRFCPFCICDAKLRTFSILANYLATFFNFSRKRVNPSRKVVNFSSERKSTFSVRLPRGYNLQLTTLDIWVFWKYLKQKFYNIYNYIIIYIIIIIIFPSFPLFHPLQMGKPKCPKL